LNVKATIVLNILVLLLINMSGSYIQLDEEVWTEIPNRHIHRSGNVYASKVYKNGYEVRLFIRKTEE
jgi:hypothetical protein